MDTSRIPASSSLPMKQRFEGAERPSSLSVQPPGDSLENRDPLPDETRQPCCFVRCMMCFCDFFASIFRRLFCGGEKASTNPKKAQPDAECSVTQTVSLTPPSDTEGQTQKIAHPIEEEPLKNKEPVLLYLLLNALESCPPADIADKFLNEAFKETPNLTVGSPFETYFEFGQRGLKGVQTQLWILYKLITSNQSAHLHESNIRAYLIFLHQETLKEAIRTQLSVELPQIEIPHYPHIQALLETELEIVNPLKGENRMPEEASETSTPITNAVKQATPSTLEMSANEPPIVKTLRQAIEIDNWSVLAEEAGQFKTLPARMQLEILYAITRDYRFRERDSPFSVIVLYYRSLKPPYCYDIEKQLKKQIYNLKGSDIAKLGTILKTLLE